MIEEKRLPLRDRIFLSDDTVRTRIKLVGDQIQQDQEFVHRAQEVIETETTTAPVSEALNANQFHFLPARQSALDSDKAEIAVYQRLQTARRSARTRVGKLIASVFRG